MISSTGIAYIVQGVLQRTLASIYSTTGVYRGHYIPPWGCTGDTAFHQRGAPGDNAFHQRGVQGTMHSTTGVYRGQCIQPRGCTGDCIPPDLGVYRETIHSTRGVYRGHYMPPVLSTKVLLVDLTAYISIESM